MHSASALGCVQGRQQNSFLLTFQRVTSRPPTKDRPTGFGGEDSTGTVQSMTAPGSSSSPPKLEGRLLPAKDPQLDTSSLLPFFFKENSLLHKSTFLSRELRITRAATATPGFHFTLSVRPLPSFKTRAIVQLWGRNVPGQSDLKPSLASISLQGVWKRRPLPLALGRSWNYRLGL